MTDSHDPARPRDYALEQELDSLREQEQEGHATPGEQRRAELLERRLHADQHAAEVRERQEHDRDADDQEEHTRHRRWAGRLRTVGCCSACTD